MQTSKKKVTELKEKERQLEALLNKPHKSKYKLYTNDFHALVNMAKKKSSKIDGNASSFVYYLIALSFDYGYIRGYRKARADMRMKRKREIESGADKE